MRRIREVLHLKHECGLSNRFCELYRRFEAKVDVVMRQEHRADERLFINHSGKRPVIWNRETGEAEEVELYVAVLGASNYTYVQDWPRRLPRGCPLRARPRPRQGRRPRPGHLPLDRQQTQRDCTLARS